MKDKKIVRNSAGHWVKNIEVTGVNSASVTVSTEAGGTATYRVGRRSTLRNVRGRAPKKDRAAG